MIDLLHRGAGEVAARSADGGGGSLPHNAPRRYPASGAVHPIAGRAA